MATWLDHQTLPLLGVHGPSYMFHLYLLPIQLVQCVTPAGLGIKMGKCRNLPPLQHTKEAWNHCLFSLRHLGSLRSWGFERKRRKIKVHD